MWKARVTTGLVAGALLLAGGAVRAAPLPTVQQMLGFRPLSDGVAISTPTTQEESACKVELIKGTGQGSGYLLRDPQGRPLRRFYNTRFTSVNDGTRIDIWSYYKDGVEVYRETATTNGQAPDQFRWMNAGGSKWGEGHVDASHHAHIDAWKMISPEEVSQEVLQAVIAKDFGRLQALMLSDADIKALGLPAAEAARLQDQRKQAQAKFQAAQAKLTALGDKTRWLHLETGAPACLPADQTGGSHDVVKLANATVLCETGGKNDWLQTGELIQVGAAWRLTDGPTAGLQEPAAPDMPGSEVADKELQPLVDQLRDLDARPPRNDNPGPNPAVVRYNLDRADVLEKIVGQAKAEKRDPWIRQLADCLSAAAQASPTIDKAAYNRLRSLEKQIAEAMPGSALAAYVTFREMTAEYAGKLGDKSQNVDKVQEGWLTRLAKFVEDYPQAEDAPDALLQLGMVSEFANKEIEAKNWYQKLATNFADKPVAQKAQGAKNRLEAEGKALQLSGPTLAGGTYDVSQAHGKVVVIYYWASWNNQCVGDFAKLKLLLEANAGKLELVTVNVDTKADEAVEFLRRSPAPGTHLHQDGGLDSPLAVQYGIMGLPSMFLLDKEGKVVSRTVQVNTLEDELKKQLK
jgi:thiol-disulfide isomerase/thioredoxin